MNISVRSIGRATCYSFFPIFIMGTVGLAGFTPVSSNTSSSDFFSDTFDNVRISLAGNDVEKTKVKIGIAREYVNSLEETDASVDSVQEKVNNAIQAVSDITRRVRRQDIAVEPASMRSLLSDTHDLLVLYEDKIRRLQQATSQDVLRAKLNTVLDRTSALHMLLKSDREDMKDDNQLNGSTTTAILLTLEGPVTRDGSIMHVDNSAKTFHLIGLPSTTDDTQTEVRMHVTGVLDSGNTKQLIVTKIEPVAGKQDQSNLVKKEVQGKVKKVGDAYILQDSVGQSYLLDGEDEKMLPFIDTAVVVKGKLMTDVLFVDSIEKSETKKDPFQAGGWTTGSVMQQNL